MIIGRFKDISSLTTCINSCEASFKEEQHNSDVGLWKMPFGEQLQWFLNGKWRLLWIFLKWVNWNIIGCDLQQLIQIHYPIILMSIHEMNSPKDNTIILHKDSKLKAALSLLTFLFFFLFLTHQSKALVNYKSSIEWSSPRVFFVLF